MCAKATASASEATSTATTSLEASLSRVRCWKLANAIFAAAAAAFLLCFGERREHQVICENTRKRRISLFKRRDSWVASGLTLDNRLVSDLGFRSFGCPPASVIGSSSSVGTVGEELVVREEDQVLLLQQSVNEERTQPFGCYRVL